MIVFYIYVLLSLFYSEVRKNYKQKIEKSRKDCRALGTKYIECRYLTICYPF